MKTKVLAISGSSRKDSVNKSLLEAATAIARTQGAEVNILDLRELALPLYDGDLEAASGLPEGCIRLKQAIREHHALLIASPEYNGSFTPLLKNGIDWATRPQEGFSSPFPGKVAALLAASPGALGDRLGVHLAIPAKKMGEANFQSSGAASNGNIRYLQEGAQVKDETTGPTNSRLHTQKAILE